MLLALNSGLLHRTAANTHLPISPEGMQVHRKLKKHFRRLTEAPAGKRFRRFHKRHRPDSEPSWKRVLYVSAGVGLIALGITLSIPPGVPGFVLTLAGIGIIAARSATVAHAIDRAELVLHGYRRRIIKSVRKRLDL